MTTDEKTVWRRYGSEFKSIVLKHVQESLGEGEWKRLRSMASDRKRFVNQGDYADLTAVPKELLDAAFSDDGISVKETLIPSFPPIVIGQIDGKPLYYVEGRGIYLWGESPDSRRTLQIWLTYPAYPPGW